MPFRYHTVTGQRSNCDGKIQPPGSAASIETFAETVEGLDESFVPERHDRGFYIYHVDAGYEIDSLIGNLYTKPVVELAFPAFTDTGEIAVFELSDLFVIAYHNWVTQETMDSIQDYYHVQLVYGPYEITGSRGMLVTRQSGMNTLEMANRFYESGLVEYSQPAMFRPRLCAVDPNDPLFQYQYNLYNYGQTGGSFGIDIDVRKAWEISQGNSIVHISLIDAGCTRYHEDLNSGLILWTSGYDWMGSIAGDALWEPDADPSPGDTAAHGVCTQGIISAVTNNSTGMSGVASGCSLIPFKIFDDEEYGDGNTLIPEKAISSAISTARLRKVPMVISCSWGYPFVTYIDNIAKILDTAATAGIPVVFSSGNWAYAPYNPPWVSSSVIFPANLPTVIAVGAVRKTGERWQYSGCGPELDVVAPSGATGYYDAGDLYTLDQMGDYGYNPWRVSCALTNENYNCTFGGTSGAAPQVAGILALVRSRRPDLTGFDTLKMIIDSSAVDGIGDSYDLPGWDPHYGNGLVSAFRALLAVCRGDANNNGTINIIDASYLTAFLYKGGPPPQPDTLMGDANCSGTVNMLDVSFILSYLYKGGPEPPICFNYGD